MDTTNASDAYRAARERLDERLKTLDRLLRAQGAKQFRDQKSWGYEGSINHVVEILDEAITFLGGEQEART
jgi:hypothetical protein